MPFSTSILAGIYSFIELNQGTHVYTAAALTAYYSCRTVTAVPQHQRFHKHWLTFRFRPSVSWPNKMITAFWQSTLPYSIRLPPVRRKENRINVFTSHLLDIFSAQWQDCMAREMTVRAQKHKWAPSCMWPTRQAQRLLMAPRLPLDPKILNCADKHNEWAEPEERTQPINKSRWHFLLVWHVAICSFCLGNLDIVAVGFNLPFLFFNIWQLYHH